MSFTKRSGTIKLVELKSWLKHRPRKHNCRWLFKVSPAWHGLALQNQFQSNKPLLVPNKAKRIAAAVVQLVLWYHALSNQWPFKVSKFNPTRLVACWTWIPVPLPTSVPLNTKAKGSILRRFPLITPPLQTCESVWSKVQPNKVFKPRRKEKLLQYKLPYNMVKRTCDIPTCLVVQWV